MRFGSLFSGIGGLDLGLERAGMECVWQVEIDEWCSRVLAKHWPDTPRWRDIKDFLAHTDADSKRCLQGGEPSQGSQEGRESRGVSQGLDSLAVDLIAGGFPCQPVSFAGRRRGQDDARWLWPEFAHTVRLLRPRWVLVENVPGLLVRGGVDVIRDLASLGYVGEWDCIPAAAVGAPHLRYRVFVVAYANSQGQSGSTSNEGTRQGVMVSRNVANAESKRPREPVTRGSRESEHATRRSETGMAHSNGAPGDTTWRASETIFRPETLERFRRRGSGEGDHWAVEPDVGRVANGIPRRVDRLRGLGNAVVPQVAEWVGRRIMEAEAA